MIEHVFVSDPIDRLDQVLDDLAAEDRSAWGEAARSQRLTEVLEEKSDIPDAPELSSAPGPRAIRGEIEFRNLSFRYSNDAPWVLKDFSLIVPARCARR